MSARIWAAAIGWVTYGSPDARRWSPWASIANSIARSIAETSAWGSWRLTDASRPAAPCSMSETGAVARCFGGFVGFAGGEPLVEGDAGRAGAGRAGARRADRLVRSARGARRVRGVAAA